MKSQARLFYSHKFFGCLALLTEVEGVVQFVFSYGQLSFELEIDYVASRYIYSLLALGTVRLLLVTLLLKFSSAKLNQVIQAKLYHSETFGSVVTFFSDLSIMQLYCYTAYLYDFSLPLVSLISIVSYVYYKFIRM